MTERLVTSAERLKARFFFAVRTAQLQRNLGCVQKPVGRKDSRQKVEGSCVHCPNCQLLLELELSDARQTDINSQTTRRYWARRCKYVSCEGEKRDAEATGCVSEAA
jgi:hypothetical protein